MFRERDKTIDIAKAIGIILIIAMHVGCSGVIFTCLPLFYFISGIFAPNRSKCSFSDGVFRKTKRLLIPCFCYMIFFAIVDYGLTKLNAPEISYTHLFSYLSADLLFFRNFLYQPYHPTIFPHAFTLWYLNALWLSFLMWFLLRSFFEGEVRNLWGGARRFLHCC